MKQLLQRILSKPVAWLANRYASRPNLQRVLAALSELYQHVLAHPGKRGLLLTLTATDARIIVFSDQHKGAKDGSDDFMLAEPTYLAALQYYLAQGFHFISLGDEEELWENRLDKVKEHNLATIALQQQFVQQQRYTKVYGNHDLYWNNDPFASSSLEQMYQQPVRVYEAVLLQLQLANDTLPVLLTHGHQGDGQSDGNWFSAWFVARIWAPLQSYLGLNLNTPATSEALKTIHNRFMYEWSKQEQHPVLITGHTHQPVFASLTHLEWLYHELHIAERQQQQDAIAALKKEIHFRQQDYDFVRGNYADTRPCYFNTGCCCYTDGDITGIEIADGMIRLVKWKKAAADNDTNRMVLEEMPLSDLL